MEEFLDAFTGGINEDMLALEDRVKHNKQNEVRDASVLYRYVCFVESKHKGILGSFCLHFNEKYKIAMRLLDEDDKLSDWIANGRY